MVKLSWYPSAAEMLLGLGTADQRRIVEAIGAFRERLEREETNISGLAQHCISASGYDLYLRVSQAGVEVEVVKLSEDLP